MDIVGQRVLFHLSPEGRKALERIVARKASFPALVVDIDSLGPVIRMRHTGRRPASETFPVMLLRWDYIATMTFEYHQPVLETRTRIGFSLA
jgi:hypothetical protein